VLTVVVFYRLRAVAGYCSGYRESIPTSATDGSRMLYFATFTHRHVMCGYEMVVNLVGCEAFYVGK
jgi:hypothetical protein